MNQSQEQTSTPQRNATIDHDSSEPVIAPRKLRCQVRGAKKSFGNQQILKGVDLEIAEGAFAVLVGPSGCGKSTLLRLVAGLEEFDEGAIFIGDRDVTHLPPRERDIAMVFQSYALYPHLTVRENLAFGLKIRGTPPNEIETRVRDASKMLALDPYLDRMPKQLSGGQRQRVAMGRAIVRRPQIFLFDEPLSNLDAALRAEVRVEIRRNHDHLKATTLYVTHDQVEAMTLADTLWVMNGGIVEQKGAPLDVYEKPRSEFVATFLGSPQMNMLDAKLEKDGARWFANGSGARIEVSEDRFGVALIEGRAVRVGVRPHDLVRTKDGQEKVADLHVEIVEALGFEAFAHGWLKASGPRVICRLEANEARSAKAGDQIAVTAITERVHLFDPKSGLALDAK
jgi:sn-glycerol 3-phosphate transport system ATP-binding protein/multiple sugar transport system ATP-binding protein